MSSKQTICVVNGERYWHEYFADFNVRYCQLQNSQWALDKTGLIVCDAQGTTHVDAVLWRVGALRPHSLHRTVLDIINRAGIPCVNNADSLLRGFDRLAMANEMRKINLPQIDCSIATGTNALDQITPEFPCIIKIGNYHAGYGKMKIDTYEQWMDFKDVYFATDDYVTVEPYIEYQRDVRCLIIGDTIWAMARQGKGWKANSETISYQLIDVPTKLEHYTILACDHLKSNILGLDFLETPTGEWLLLETNDIPGLAGFPEATRYLLAQTLITKMQNTRGR